jgi:hypothetical protein
MCQDLLVHFSPKENYNSILQNGLQAPVLRPYEELYEKYRARILAHGQVCESLEDIYNFFDEKWTFDSQGGRYVISVTVDPPEQVNSQLEDLKNTCDKWIIDYKSIIDLIDRVFLNVKMFPISVDKRELMDALPYIIRDFGSWVDEPELYAFEHIPHAFIQMKEHHPFIPPEFLTRSLE